jgi:dipeptidyl aminopeptidase/acylaminoacyl peptidase
MKRVSLPWLWFSSAALVIGLGLMLFNTSKKEKISFQVPKNESAGANRGGRSDEAFTPSIVNQKSKIKNKESLLTSAAAASGDHPHLYDSSPANSGVLFSKTDSKSDTWEDLWLRDATGKERFIANEVTVARFSPDGKKIAYATGSHEVFIETLAGERLAEIPRASDPMWRSDSTALSFSAIPSLDYPELQQVSVYDLNSGQLVESDERN